MNVSLLLWCIQKQDGAHVKTSASVLISLGNFSGSYVCKGVQKNKTYKAEKSSRVGPSDLWAERAWLQGPVSVGDIG